MADKPIGVMPLSIIAIALGAMGFFGGSFNLTMLLLNPKPDTPMNDPKLEALNAEFQQRTEAIVNETRPFQLVAMPAMIGMSLLLAVAGIGGIKLRGRVFLQLAFAGSLIVDTIGSGYGVIVQAKLMEVMKWYFKEIAATHPSFPGMDMVMQVSLYMGLFFGVGWLIARTVFYLMGLIYFGRRNVRQAFDGASA